jgi:hypothetical protein
MSKSKKLDQFLTLLPDKFLQDKEFLEVWLDWLDYRKEIKHPLTRIAAKRQIKLLDNYSAKIATAMVDRSINMGWRGIFPLNENHELMRQEQPLEDPGAQSSNELRPI